MSGPLALARVLAGPDADDEAVVRQFYGVLKFEHEFFYGKDREPLFPSFPDWLLSQPSSEKD